MTYDKNWEKQLKYKYIDRALGDFLYEQRSRYQIVREKLAAGLCSDSILDKVERGDRYLADKMMRDRLLGRLGESGYNYENYLTPAEYRKWVERRDLLDALEGRQLAKAEEILQRFFIKQSKGRMPKVKRQFYLAMQLQWMELNGEDRETIVPVLKQAVELTIPQGGEKNRESLILSVAELNLLLEYDTYRKPDDLSVRYEAIIRYAQADRFDEECKAMFLSKAAYYYCRHQLECLQECHEPVMRKAIIEKALQISEIGMESLRDNKRIYFAWELLQVELQFLDLYIKEEISTEEQNVCRERRDREHDFFVLIDSLYEQYQVPKQTCSYTYFYREYEIYNINEVISARRRMLEYTGYDFEEVCTPRSIYRIESSAHGVRNSIARDLFKELKLSGEFQRAQLITSSQSALRMEKQFRVACNDHRFEEAEKLFEEYRRLATRGQLINEQYLMFQENMLQYRTKKMNQKQCVTKLIETLELTMPLRYAVLPNDLIKRKKGKVCSKYLTCTEISILKDLADVSDYDIGQGYYNILEEYFKKMGKKDSPFDIFPNYSFVMCEYASRLGNIGEYKKSDSISMELIRRELMYRRITYMEPCLYSIIWNYQQCIEKGLSVEKDLSYPEYINFCILIDTYCKNAQDEAWMRKKLEAYSRKSLEPLSDAI